MNEEQKNTYFKELAIARVMQGRQYAYSTTKDELEILDDSPAPTDEEIQKAVNDIKNEWEKFSYARKRSKEYNRLNQFEMLYDDMANGTNHWITAINEIKAKYPKPNNL